MKRNGGFPVRAVLLGVLILALSGCASVPEPIRDAPERVPLPDEVRADPEAFKGERVRWGGTIVSVANKASHTELELVARRLDERARPMGGDRSLGRFIARVPGFLDPAVFESGRRLTVTGTVEGVVTREIGEFAYRFPVVAVDGRYLWEREPPRREGRDYPYDPYWHDPWYPRSMFYPYCPYGVSPRYCW